MSKRKAKPWDLLNKDLLIQDQAVVDQRMSLCEECPELLQITHQCRQCGCYMPAKTKLSNASCPMGKWDIVE